ncbi:hypothetical protein BC629DRAFT_1257965, partial [Irpex lacteus]
GNRRHIPQEQKQLVVMMSRTLDNRTIARATEISERTIRRILELWRNTGCVEQRPYVCGRPRVLSMVDVLFLEGLVEHTPDLYLSELRDRLLEMRGIAVSEQTIANAL